MEQTETKNQTDEAIESVGLSPEQIAEYNSRFRATPGAVIDFQLYRLVPPKGPAQPVPAQIPVGSCNDLKEAVQLADRLSDNCTILICKREWYAKSETGWSLAHVGQQIELKEPDEKECPKEECEKEIKGSCDCEVDTDGSSGNISNGTEETSLD